MRGTYGGILRNSFFFVPFKALPYPFQGLVEKGNAGNIWESYKEHLLFCSAVLLKALLWAYHF